MSVELWTLDALVESYKQHLRRSRGLRETTLDGYGRLVRRFVGEALGEDPIDPSRLCGGDVVAFMAVMASSFFKAIAAAGSTAGVGRRSVDARGIRGVFFYNRRRRHSTLKTDLARLRRRAAVDLLT